MYNPDFSPELAPNAPAGWEIVNNGKGYRTTYRCEAGSHTADLDLFSELDTDVVEVVLDDYSDYSDHDTRTRRVELTVPKTQDVETLEKVATEWIEKARNNEL